MADPHLGPCRAQPPKRTAAKKPRSRRRDWIDADPEGRRRPGRCSAWSRVTAVVVIGYSTTKLPNPNTDFQTATTFVYYNDGKTQLGNFAIQNRQPLDLQGDAREHQAGRSSRRRTGRSGPTRASRSAAWSARPG